MKTITKLSEYKILAALPGEISKQEKLLKDLQEQYRDKLERKEELKSKLERVYSGESGLQSSADIQKQINKIESDIENLQPQIQEVKDKLDTLPDELSEAKAAYKKKVTPIIDKKIEGLQKAITEADQINTELQDLGKLCSFGSLTKKVRAVPIIPTVTNLNGSESKTYSKKVEAWNSKK